ncbi:M3 family oligoendopeptidase [Bacillus sp. DJP31]|uniref:M3 family oligoendopeptidase n=1 Tax=Bacillus sp. DJP31 TaxID=3409789 RepID=UPI003BB4EC49
MQAINEDQYVNLDMELYIREFNLLLEGFDRAKTFEEQNNRFVELNNHRFLFETSFNLVNLRHMQDFNDEFYSGEYTIFNQNEPIYQSLVRKYYYSIIESPFREQLELKWGQQLFRLAELKVRTTSDDVLEDLQEENELVSEYLQLLGKGEVVFQGGKLNLSALLPHMLSLDRDIREQAYVARSHYFEEKEDEFDQLLDRLVKIRSEIAKKLGYSTFTELGYARMNRTSFAPNDLAKYRIQVKQYGVPFVSSLREKQRIRIGVEKLKYYDDRFFFQEGSPTPLGSTDEILKKASILFSELSNETKDFFEKITEQRYLDLENRVGKRGGGLATYIGNQKAPFIFANFNGTANDIRVLTHEAGHAFQFFMSNHWSIPEYLIPVDSAELFSFTMERFLLPWMSLFFGEDTTKYKFSHLTEAFYYMPFASAVDEFEYYLYESPEVSIVERKQKWRELERSYLPELDYDGNDFMERGGSFYGIAHLFMTPFYFMDYDLAHFCSVQMWERFNFDPKSAWESYLAMCKAGGSKSFKELLHEANLNSPFEDNSLEPLLESVQNWIITGK